MIGVQNESVEYHYYAVGALKPECGNHSTLKGPVRCTKGPSTPQELRHCTHESCTAGKQMTRSTFGAKKNALEHEKKAWLHKNCGTACATCERLRKEGLLWKTPKERALCRERQRGKRHASGRVATDSRGQPRLKLPSAVTKVPPVLPAGYAMFTWPHVPPYAVPRFMLPPPPPPPQVTSRSRLFGAVPSSPLSSSPELGPPVDLGLDESLFTDVTWPQAPSLSDLEVLEDLYKAHGIAA